MPSLYGQVVSIPMVGIRIAAVQLQRTLEFRLCSTPIPFVVQYQTKRSMGFGGLWVDFNGPECCRMSPRKRFRRRREAVPGESAIAISQAGIRDAVARVLVDGLLEVDFGLLDALCRALVPVVATLEIGLICGRVDAARSRESGYLGWRQGDVDLTGDRSRDRILQRQDVLDVTIIALGPAIGLIRDLNQVNGDSHAVWHAANATFNDVVGVQLSADLAYA